MNKGFQRFLFILIFLGNVFYLYSFETTFIKFKLTTMGAGKVFASVLAGAAAGAVLGILFAPEKGTETRRKIAEKGSDFAGTVKDKYNNISDTVSEKFDAAKQKLSNLVSEGTDAGKDMVSQAKEKANAMRNDVRNPNPVNS
jgi:gas vesicle protein